MCCQTEQLLPMDGYSIISLELVHIQSVSVQVKCFNVHKTVRNLSCCSILFIPMLMVVILPHTVSNVA